MKMNSDNLVNVSEISKKDLEVLALKGKHYGSSWRKRGGVGAFFNTERKIDRFIKQAEDYDLDIFKAFAGVDPASEENIIESIRDLRRYLLLIENHLIGA